METADANEAHRAELLRELAAVQGNQIRRLRNQLFPRKSEWYEQWDDVNRPLGQAYLPPDVYEIVVRS
jgi:hypothetical protein